MPLPFPPPRRGRIGGALGHVADLVRLGGGFDVLGLRDFRLLFGAAVVSLLGDGIVPVALTFGVLDLTGSASDLGIVLASGSVAVVASLLFGGVVADRVGRRAVMIAADVIRMLGQAAVGLLLVTGHPSVLALAASQAVLGAATGFFNPALSGLMPAVAGERLQQANALRALALAAGSIGGPALGGLLVLTIGAGPALLIDAGTYAASALLLAAMRGQPRVRVSAQKRFLVDLRDGFAELRSRRWAWSIIVVASCVNTIGVAFLVLGPVVAKRELGGAAAWALILVARAIGLFIGGLLLLRVQPRRPLLTAVPACAAAALPLMLLAPPAPVELITLAAAVAGFGAVVFNTLWETTLQEHVPAHARSRVSSYDWFGSLALQPLGYVLIGPLAAAIGISGALYLSAGIELAMLVPLLAIRDVRTMTRRSLPSSSRGEPERRPVGTHPSGSPR